MSTINLIPARPALSEQERSVLDRHSRAAFQLFMAALGIPTIDSVTDRMMEDMVAQRPDDLALALCVRVLAEALYQPVAVSAKELAEGWCDEAYDCERRVEEGRTEIHAPALFDAVHLGDLRRDIVSAHSWLITNKEVISECADLMLRDDFLDSAYEVHVRSITAEAVTTARKTWRGTPMLNLREIDRTLGNIAPQRTTV